MTTSAPYALSRRTFSWDILSGIVKMQRYPFSAAATAMPTPVLPLVPFDDGPAGLQIAAPLGVLDDGESDAILDRPAWVGVFRLAVDRGADAGADPAEPDERRPADGIEDVVVGRLVGVGHGVTPPTPGWRK